jgi:hypothetical protein
VKFWETCETETSDKNSVGAKIMRGSGLGVLLAALVGALAGGAPHAFGQGLKIIQNNTKETLYVTIYGRNGTVHSNLPPVKAVIAPGGSSQLQYGNAQNPNMNTLIVKERSRGSEIAEHYRCTASPGTNNSLNDLFNGNTTLVITYDRATYGYGLTGHN